MDVHVTEKSTGTSNGPETTQENGALIAQVLGPGGRGGQDFSASSLFLPVRMWKVLLPSLPHL